MNNLTEQLEVLQGENKHLDILTKLLAAQNECLKKGNYTPILISVKEMAALLGVNNLKHLIQDDMSDRTDSDWIEAITKHLYKPSKKS